MGRAVVGAVLVLLGAVPIYRYADRPEAGLAGGWVVELIEISAGVVWSGTLVLVLAGAVAGILAPADAWDRGLRTLAGWVRRPSDAVWAGGVAAVAFALTLWFTLAVLDGKPNLIDALAQLVQARYMAAGSLAGPVPEPGEFWAFQNMIYADGGWVSHFPPGHSAWLALFLRIGLLELSGAVSMAVTAAFTFLALRRLLPTREIAARLGGLAVALSPFLVSHSGSYMNHGLAAMLGVLAVYFALRARDGSAAWGLAIGGALGALLVTRPLFAIVMGLGVIVPMGVAGLRRGVDVGGLAARIGLAVVAAAPFVAAVLLYNARFFGDPFLSGYQVTAGEAVGLGFHVDPWGNTYSPAIATALTSGDLIGLSLALLEIPLPLVALVGLWLALARRIPEGAGLLTTWAVAPVAALFFYWHHGFFMGPRLLADAAPAWAGVVALGLVELVRMTPRTLPGGAVRFAPRTALVTTLALGVLAGTYLAPTRLVRRGGEFLPSMRLEPPVPRGPSLVFVHGAWSGRVFARMVAEGWQLHEIETALRLNGLCEVQRGLDRPESGILSALDLEPRPTSPAVVEVEPFPGNKVVLRREAVTPGGLTLPPECAAELAADRSGIVEVAVHFWQGDLPGLGGEGPLYVRDMGPERNRAVLERYPDRTPYLLTRRELRGAPLLLPYAEGMARLWSRPDTPAPAR